MNFQGAIFDLDGTIIDSMQMWAHCISRFLKFNGYTPSETADEDTIPLNVYDTALYVKTNYMPSLSCEEIIKAMDNFVKDEFHYNLALKKGADEFIIGLKQKGVKLAVATATDRHLVKAVLKRHGLLQFFDYIVTCTEVGAGKNVSALVFENALENIGVKKENCIVFEDSLYAAQTAKRANFCVAGIFDEYSSKNAKKMTKCCDYYFNSWQDAMTALL